MDKDSGQVPNIDACDLHKYRTEIPNNVDDMGLSVYAFRLYAHFKRVAGDSGECFQGTRTLAEHCGMSVGMVGKAKRELVEHGLIQMTPGNPKTNTADTIVITDIWRANFAAFAKSDICSPGEQADHTVNDPVQDMNTPVHQVNDPVQDVNTPVHQVNDPVQDVNTPVHQVNERSNPLKKEPIKKEPREERETRARTRPLPTPPQHPSVEHISPGQEMYGAVCEILGIDYKIITNEKKVQIAQAVTILRDAAYTLDDLRRFLSEVWFKDWRWTKFGQRPTLTQLREEIGKLRAGIPVDMPLPMNGNGPAMQSKGADAVDRVWERLAEKGIHL